MHPAQPPPDRPLPERANPARDPRIRLLGVTVIASSKVEQRIGDASDVIVSIPGKAAYLIRRHTDPASGRCPLRDIEIRRMDAEGHPHPGKRL